MGREVYQVVAGSNIFKKNAKRSWFVYCTGRKVERLVGVLPGCRRPRGEFAVEAGKGRDSVGVAHVLPPGFGPYRQRGCNHRPRCRGQCCTWHCCTPSRPPGCTARRPSTASSPRRSRRRTKSPRRTTALGTRHGEEPGTATPHSYIKPQRHRPPSRPFGARAPGRPSLNVQPQHISSYPCSPHSCPAALAGRSCGPLLSLGVSTTRTRRREKEEEIDEDARRLCLGRVLKSLRVPA